MGFASSATKVLHANRALLKKRKSYGDIRKSYEGYVSKGDLNFRELTPFEQQKIRDKIIAQTKRDKAHNIKMGFISFLLLSLIVFGIYKLF